MVIYYQESVLNCVDWGETLENGESVELGNDYSTAHPCHKYPSPITENSQQKGVFVLVNGQADAHHPCHGTYFEISLGSVPKLFAHQSVPR